MCGLTGGSRKRVREDDAELGSADAVTEYCSEHCDELASARVYFSFLTMESV